MGMNILTIRVDDIFEQKCGCPICLAQKMSEDNACEYIAGAAMMEPDIRIETNKKGFCARHFDMLLETSARLPLALILSTHLAEIQNETYGKKHELFAKNMKLERSAEFEKTCYVCERMDADLDRFLHGMFNLYKESEKFRRQFSEQEYICFPHRNLLLNKAQKALKKDILKQFSEEVERLSGERLAKLCTALDELCRSFDYRNVGKPLSESAQNAPEKAIEFLTGRAAEK